MANIAVGVLFLLCIYFIFFLLRRHGHGIVPKRGVGVEADLGAMADARRVRVRSLTGDGPDRLRVVLTPDQAGAGGPDTDLVVGLAEGEFGFDLLQDWQKADKLLALVTPPGGRLVRLRSIDDLQHLTLRRIDGG